MSTDEKPMTDEEWAEHLRTHKSVVVPFMGGRCFYVDGRGMSHPAMHLDDDETDEQTHIAETRLKSTRLLVFGFEYTAGFNDALQTDVPYDRTCSKPETWHWAEDRRREVYRSGASGMTTLVIP